MNMSEQMKKFEKRPHLTKIERIPRSYKEAENVLTKVKACEGSVKTVLSNSRLRGAVFNKVYSLVINILKQRRLLDKIILDTGLLEKESFLRRELASILVYELIFSKGLPGESKPVLSVRNYEKEINEAYERVSKDDTLQQSGLLTLPRYARVNTLATSVPDVLRDLWDCGYNQVDYKDDIALEEFLILVRNLKTGSFLVDYHFKDLLVFANEENLTKWHLFRKGHVFIHDKSSYIPVHALDPKPESTVLDACAAPGMKTVHMATRMENKGKIYACERDEKRFETLKGTIEFSKVEMCDATCEDFYMVNANDPKFKTVEYILVDPTCSGSGMVSRMDQVTDTEESKNSLRLQKLAGFQILLLKHALSFPCVKRVVYSTCSITKEENEFVVHEVLNKFNHIFKLVSVMPNWPIRGLEEYEFGHLCFRAYPEKSLTNGFFVALFERKEFDQEQYNSSFSNPLKKRKNKRKGKFENKSEDFNLKKVKIETGGEYAEGCIKDESDQNFNEMDGNDLKENEVANKGRKKRKRRHTVEERGEVMVESTEIVSCENEVMVETGSDYAEIQVKDESDQNFNEMDRNDLKENVVVSKGRKKGKKRHTVEELGEAMVESTEIFSHENEVSKVKKHKKRRSRVHQEFTEEVAEHTLNGSTQNEVKKNEKPKKKCIENMDSEQIDECTVNCSSQNDMVMKVKKKHKKKHCKELIDETENTLSNSQIETISVQSEIKKKHKQKRKSKEYIIGAEGPNEIF